MTSGDPPPEIIERGVRALLEGLRRQRPGQVIDVEPREQDAILDRPPPGGDDDGGDHCSDGS